MFTPLIQSPGETTHSRIANPASARCDTIKTALLIIGLLGSLALVTLVHVNLPWVAQLGDNTRGFLLFVGLGCGAAISITLYYESTPYYVEPNPSPLENEIFHPPDQEIVYPLSKQSLQKLKGDLLPVLKNTMALLKQRFYNNSKNQKIHLQSTEELRTKTRVFKYDQDPLPVRAKYKKQEVFTVVKDFLDVAHVCSIEKRQVAIINFANAETPGGDFLKGKDGLEERLLYRSALAGLMNSFYEKSCNCGQLKEYPLYNQLLLTRDVQIFRNSLFEPLDRPFTVGVISVAASSDMEYLKASIYTQLKAAYDTGYNTIVIGAFECKAFKDSPEAIAKMYKDVLNTYFKQAFREVIFSASNPLGIAQFPVKMVD